MTHTEEPITQDKRIDLTGRDRLVRNTIISWASELFIIAIGFIMPRLMHEMLGQSMLGIWDFTWSFVNLLRMAGLGISSSVNRFVAKYRAEQTPEKLDIFISTVASVQLLIAAFIVASLIPIYLFIGSAYANELGDDLKIAQISVIVLGAGIAIEILFDSMRGVITGHHRWDIHNLLYAVSALLGLIFMSSTLLAGGNIVHVAFAYLTSVISIELLRVYLGLRVAPYIKRNFRLFSKSEAKELLKFGAKTVLIAFPQGFIVQSVNLLTASLLGPAALAIYARQFALIRHLSTMVTKFTMILSPTASSLQSLNNHNELAKFFVSTVRFNFAITIPAIAFFSAFGDLMIGIWMGPDYQNWALIVVLSIGHLFVYGQDACIRVMQGMNAHGRLAIYVLIAMSLTAAITYLCLRPFEWSLISSALLLSIPVTVAYGFLTPIYACLTIKVSIKDYICNAICLPLACNLPFGLLLSASRYFYQQNHYLLSIILFGIAGLVESFVYFKYLLPDTVKDKIIIKFRKPLKVAG